MDDHRQDMYLRQFGGPVSGGHNRRHLPGPIQPGGSPGRRGIRAPARSSQNRSSWSICDTGPATSSRRWRALVTERLVAELQIT
jgi:hypothetical protein